MSDVASLQQHVESLIQKADKATTADGALKYSQAACNAANSIAQLMNTVPKADK